MKIDPELNGLAVLALKNALYRKLQRVMASYKAAANGLEYDDDEFYSVHAFMNDNVKPDDDKLNIWAGYTNPDSIFGPDYVHSNGFDTVLEALEYDRADQVWVEGCKVFERRDGEWYYVENST